MVLCWKNISSIRDFRHDVRKIFCRFSRTGPRISFAPNAFKGADVYKMFSEE